MVDVRSRSSRRCRSPSPTPILVEQPVEPEPVVADAEPERARRYARARGRAAAEPTPIRPLRPIGETFVRQPRPAPAPRDAVAAAADSEALAARRAQLDLLGQGRSWRGPVGPERRVLPYPVERCGQPGGRSRRRRVLGCLGARGLRGHQPGRRPPLRRSATLPLGDGALLPALRPPRKAQSA